MHDYEHSGVFPIPGMASLASSVTVSLLSRIDPTQAEAGRHATSHLRWCVRATSIDRSILSRASAQLLPKATHAVAALTRGAFASALAYVTDRHAGKPAEPKRLTPGEKRLTPRSLVAVNGMRSGSVSNSSEDEWIDDESA